MVSNCRSWFCINRNRDDRLHFYDKFVVAPVFTFFAKILCSKAPGFIYHWKEKFRSFQWAMWFMYASSVPRDFHEETRVYPTWWRNWRVARGLRSQSLVPNYINKVTSDNIYRLFCLRKAEQPKMSFLFVNRWHLNVRLTASRGLCWLVADETIGLRTMRDRVA